MKKDKDEKKEIFAVKNEFNEIESVFETYEEACQLAGYLNGKYLRAQDDIPSKFRNKKFVVMTFPVKKFYRRKKLFWLVVVYFDNFKSRSGCPHSLCKVDKTEIVDYEIDTIIRYDETMNHMYFTVPIKTTTKELDHIVYEKLMELWEKEKQ